MCGRFALGIPKKRLEEYFGTPFPDDTPLTYNVAPGRFMPVVGLRDGARASRLLRWGLVPSWAKDEKTGNRLINARSETASHKPSFRAAFARRRCIVPAQAFYEWQKTGSGKVPHAIFPAVEPLLSMAGLWEYHERPDGSLLRTFTVLTCEANALVARVHHRMPVILLPQDHHRWLSAQDEAADLLVPCRDELLTIHPVSTQVNAPANDHEGLLCAEKA